MTAPELLEHWRQTLGDARLPDVGNVYQRSSLETGGLRGTFEVWQQASGERRSLTKLGDVYSVLSVYNGHEGWIRDQNGLVRSLAAQELEAEATQAYLESFSPLTGGRLSGQVTYHGQEDAFYVLELLPRGGRGVKVFLDADTFLPAKREETVNGRIETTTLTDWREVEGIKFPFGARQSTGDAKYDFVFQTEEVRFNESFPADFFVRPQPAVAPLFAAPRVSLPFDLSSNQIHVTGQIGDSRPLNVIIDTGASASPLNSQVVRELGLEETGQLEVRGGGDGSQDMGFVEGVTLKLGDFELPEATFLAVDLSPLESLMGHIDVVLGYEFLGRAVLEVDYLTRTVTFHAPESFAYQGSGTRVPFTLQNNHPHIRAEIALGDGKTAEGTFMVDTGARPAVHLNRGFVEKHEIKAVVPKVLELPARIGGVGGASQSSRARVPAVILGGHVLKQVVASLSESDAGLLETDAFAGLLGGDLLRRFRVFFDYGRQELILEPNAKFGAPFVYDASGLHLISEDFQTVTVEDVLPGSPAERAGIRVGDVLEVIDETPTSELTLSDARERLVQAGETRQLRVRRADGVINQTLHLEALV